MTDQPRRGYWRLRFLELEGETADRVRALAEEILDGPTGYPTITSQPGHSTWIVEIPAPDGGVLGYGPKVADAVSDALANLERESGGA